MTLATAEDKALVPVMETKENLVIERKDLACVGAVGREAFKALQFELDALDDILATRVTWADVTFNDRRRMLAGLEIYFDQRELVRHNQYNLRSAEAMLLHPALQGVKRRLEKHKLLLGALHTDERRTRYDVWMVAVERGALEPAPRELVGLMAKLRNEKDVTQANQKEGTDA